MTAVFAQILCILVTYIVSQNKHNIIEIYLVYRQNMIYQSSAYQIRRNPFRYIDSRQMVGIYFPVYYPLSILVIIMIEWQQPGMFITRQFNQLIAFIVIVICSVLCSCCPMAVSLPWRGDGHVGGAAQELCRPAQVTVTPPLQHCSTAEYIAVLSSVRSVDSR